jgi:hypothetical protein
LHAMKLAVDAERDRWLCFFRGLNVFGRGKIAMPELRRRCSEAFDKSGLPVRFLDYYRGTGNVALSATGVPAEKVLRLLFEAVPKPCAMVRPRVVGQLNDAFRAWPAPVDVRGFRWTRGACLLCEGEPEATQLAEKPNLGVFVRVAPTLVAVYRKERETNRGTLDPSDRRGGWAAISNHIERVLGGRWTARSLDVIQELSLRVT